MMDLPLPLAQDVVLVGGGHAHALVLRRWGMNPVPGARLTLIDPGATAPYTGMLPGFVAGHYTRDELDIDLVKLARFADARLILGRVEAIDRDNRRLLVAGRPPIRYDIASIDIGITSAMDELDGFAEHAVPAKPLGRFADRWAAFRDGGGGDVAVIGGGVAGVELALAMRHALGSRGAGGRMTVIEAENLLSGVGERTRARLRTALSDARIDVREQARVEAVSSDAVHLADGSGIPAKLTVGAAGARPYSWLEKTGLALTDGFITVDRHLRSVTDPAIYAAGDCVHLPHAPRPKAGVFAVRAAPILHDNLRASLTGGKLKTFSPQKHYLKLISMGGKTALAEKYGHSVGGQWAWRWKDRIDRAFMDRVNDAPRMAQTVPEAAVIGMAEALGPKPLCGGCGAKVGPGVLAEALTGLVAVRDDIERGAGDDAAILRVGGARQAITVDTLRAVWPDPFVMTRIAALHALGDIWAMGAEPQSALVQIGLPRMAETMQAAWLEEIMAAAGEVFAAEGAEIVGGHTTLGAEFTIGFTLTGLVERTLSGAQAGDRLLLTRPIGTGVLLAAEMERKAKGDGIARLLDVLTTTQGDAARALAPLAHAMTDVTGFGLAGHLSRLASEAGLSARLELETIPVHEGAVALAAQGVRSSIWQANRNAVGVDVPDTPASDLLFDPQTCGGLLAALPPDKADEALDSVLTLGHRAALIGTMTEGSLGQITAR